MTTLYFNTTDLQARLYRTGCWIAAEADRLAKKAKYSGRIDPCCMTNLQYVVAALEALECYTPITSEAEDGVVNCLTEAYAENLFNNISKITGICFLPKNTVYTTAPADADFTGIELHNSTNFELDNNLGAATYSFTTNESIPRIIKSRS
jgi:hypothetical protein